MARYIDADALIENVKRVYCTDCNNYNQIRCRACGTGDALDTIDDAPAADVVPKREGEWASDRADYVCTCCGTRYKDDILFIQAGEIKLPNYCPDCGAKMAKLKEAAP
jgi:DNA-directed RNA polymerase subunit RPC12/RpoP